MHTDYVLMWCHQDLTGMGLSHYDAGKTLEDTHTSNFSHNWTVSLITTFLFITESQRLSDIFVVTIRMYEIINTWFADLHPDSRKPLC